MSNLAHAFNTLHYAKRLRAAGVKEKEAEVHAETIAEAINILTDDTIATKQDIRYLELQIKNLEESTKVEIKRLGESIKNLEESTKLEIKNLEESTKLEIKNLEESTKLEIKNLEKSTKLEIKNLEKSTKLEIKSSEERMNNQFNQLRLEMKQLEERIMYRMTTRLGAMLVGGFAISGVIFGVIIKFL